jgi:hypothetical protein
VAVQAELGEQNANLPFGHQTPDVSESG